MPTYKTIHTRYGLQRMAQAEATGTPINLTHMAVGDGNGSFAIPSEIQDHLVRERFRDTVNRVFQDHDDPTIFTGELVVPATAAGFTVREIGIFDADGGLFAVGNMPEIYKPNLDEGAYGDCAFRIEFMVTNVAVVVLKIDPNVAVATQFWVRNNVTPALLFPGGTARQVLRKRSNADGDTEWADPTEVNVVVNTIEEIQSLAAGQTTVDLVETTTKGLAVYINGDRIRKEVGVDGWQPDPAVVTRVILGKAYAGMKAVFVQNEPAGSLANPLDKDQNLGDVLDKALARKNLDVYNKAESNSAGQPGDVKFTTRATAPTGWLKANGAAVSRTAYASLFEVIGEMYGKGDGFNTFNLPDLRGEFIRGLDDGRGVDPNRKLGSAQSSQNLAHNHTGSTDTDGSHTHSYVDGRPVHPPGDPGLQNGAVFKGIWENLDLRETQSAGSHWHNITTSTSGGTEARPRNVALLPVIKY
jgi:phage-related tail fiber protein